MLPLRLLAASLLASASVLSAAAQSPGPLLSPPAASSITRSPSPSPTLTLPKPGPTTLPFKASPNNLDAMALQPGLQSLALKSQPGEIAALKPDTLLPPKTTQPCAKLRSYNFTRKDLRSPHPHPSSETDCTPASAGHLKTIPATSTDSK